MPNQADYDLTSAKGRAEFVAAIQDWEKRTGGGGSQEKGGGAGGSGSGAAGSGGSRLPVAGGRIPRYTKVTFK